MKFKIANTGRKISDKFGTIYIYATKFKWRACMPWTQRKVNSPKGYP